MTDLKKKLEDFEVSGYSWVDTKSMTADVLTKEGSDIESILEVIRGGVFRKAYSSKNMVVLRNGEIMMLDKGECDDGFEQD